MSGGTNIYEIRTLIRNKLRSMVGTNGESGGPPPGKFGFSIKNGGFSCNVVRLL